MDVKNISLLASISTYKAALLRLDHYSTFIALPIGFLDLMLQLHSASASSASIERIFSSFGLIHNKVRNRLVVEKATKLVFCYRMLRGRQELDF